jgi:hypothetical protein
MNCPICNYKKSLTCKITLPTFEHRNLTKISNYLFLKQCIFCKIIYNPNIKNILSISKKIFLSTKDYNFSLKNNRISSFKDSEYATKIFELYNTFCLKIKNVNILDVGALDGNLLKQIRINFNKNSKKKKKLNFVGYNYSNKKNFTSNNSFIINSLKIDDCFKNNQKYNIIISINSLQYIKKIDQFLLTVKNSLTENNSFAFFVVPDSLNNISYNFHGDEFYKFTRKNISILFSRNNLKVYFLKNNINPSHLMFYVKKAINYKNILQSDNTFLDLFAIKNKINNFLSLSKFISNKFSDNVIKIFGYRINAVILYYALIKFNFSQNKIFFITDDKVKLGKTIDNSFISKKLILLKSHNYLRIYNSLNFDEKIILSYGYKRNNVFKNILRKKYNFKNFINI